VKQAESDQMFLAMQDKGVPCVYVLFPDEGHGFARPANGIMFNILTERFLKENLGGRFQEESPREAEGNTAIVRANH
jgi:dipeptidyl aminopeptidase/acylaminoacyl peptidase